MEYYEIVLSADSPRNFQSSVTTYKKKKIQNIRLLNQACGVSSGETRLFFTTQIVGKYKILENSKPNNFALTEGIILIHFST